MVLTPQSAEKIYPGGLGAAGGGGQGSRLPVPEPVGMRVGQDGPWGPQGANKAFFGGGR